MMGEYWDWLQSPACKAHAAPSLDQDSSLPESQWHHAAEHYQEWLNEGRSFSGCCCNLLYCLFLSCLKSWQRHGAFWLFGGRQEWYCLDLFSASQSVAITFRKNGWPATSYDIKSNRASDITSMSGFGRLLLLGLGLLNWSQLRSWGSIKCNCFIFNSRPHWLTPW